MPIEVIKAGQQQQHEAKKLHAPIVVEDPDSELESGPTGKVGSVELFFKRLREKLWSYGIELDKLPHKTTPQDPPPCFDLGNADYEAWLAVASFEHNTMPKTRLDMPGEPNYCADCTASFRGKAIKAGACLFPNMRFEVHRDRVTQEKETYGVTRSANKSIEELDESKEIQFGETRIPDEAVRAQLKEALGWRRRNRDSRVVTNAEWRCIPREIRDGISIPTPPPTIQVIWREPG